MFLELEQRTLIGTKNIELEQCTLLVQSLADSSPLHTGLVYNIIKTPNCPVNAGDLASGSLSESEVYLAERSPKLLE